MAPRLRGLVLPTVLLGALVAGDARTQCTLASPFQDHMVLQRDLPVHVFGTAAPAATVNVTLGAATTTGTADATGRFLVALPPSPAGGPHELRAESGGAAVTLRDVLVGEVWLCSGQSNMEWQMRRFDDCEDDIAAAEDDGLRLYTVEHQVSLEPATAVEGRWQAATPEVVRDFSATAWFFGKELRDRLGVPVGLVSSSWGGTPAESWTRDEILRADPIFVPILEHWQQIDARWPAAKAGYDAARAAWEAEKDRAEAAGEKPPPAPAAPVGPDHPYHPSVLWNGMIAPLVPMTVRGVIWYQGESNANRAWQYQRLFPAMIRDWRRALGQGDLPFGFVQLAAFDHPTYEPWCWPELRDAQLRTLRSVPNTGMAVAIDLGEEKDIHPGRKDEVGRRLALWALGDVLGDAGIVSAGPLYRHCRIEGGHVRCWFEHAAGLRFDDGEAKGFLIAGDDGEFVPAEARIEGETVVVWSPDVPAPRAVRYAWVDWPEISLRNGAGLPASPFRSDDWPLRSLGVVVP